MKINMIRNAHLFTAIVIQLLILTSFIPVFGSETLPLPHTIIQDPYALAKVKQLIRQNDSNLHDFLEKLVVKANSFLTKKPTSVMEKTQLPPSGNKHDFYSLAAYEWPNPDTPNGLPYISRDGRINPEIYSIKDKANLDDMIYKISILAIANYFTENSTYSLKAQQLLRVWFLDKDTYMNPNLEYAEIEKGKGKFNPSGIMEGVSLPQLTDAIGLLHLSPNWSQDVQRGMEEWFSNYLNWLIKSNSGKLEGARFNNHGTYYNMQIASIALYLNKTDFTKELLGSLMQDLTNAPLEDVYRLIGVKINLDGSQPFEIRRANSLHYHIWNLYGLVLLSRIGDHVGVDLWNYQIHGTGISRALDFIVPYTVGNQTWPYSQTTQLRDQDLAFLQGILCQTMSHYDRQSYKQAYRYLDREDLHLNLQDIICNLHLKYIDARSLKN